MIALLKRLFRVDPEPELDPEVAAIIKRHGLTRLHYH